MSLRQLDARKSLPAGWCADLIEIKIDSGRAGQIVGRNPAERADRVAALSGHFEEPRIVCDGHSRYSAPEKR
jgi:hypothetical protein